ncbi:MAG: M20/M25/M40 family metallo-hydrolase [Chloroflexota bacterium]|nr:M20/M25/M40 family metallo-hydrolase [Chloroflexota bacterium]
MTGRAPAVADRPHVAELLRTLIRYDTTNPPGNERECAAYCRDVLNSVGIPAELMGNDPDRVNVISQLKGRGDAPPLLMYGHIDVVPTAAQPWDVPPFEGRLQGGYIWGRGALDMKGGVAMMMDAFMRAHLEDADLPGDVILALVTDEEAGGHTGAEWLVDAHPELFEGARYAVGEFGGFSKTYRGRKFYMVQVAEKQGCRVEAIARGPGGHGSLVHHDTAPTRMAQFLVKLDRTPLPFHIHPVTRMMVEAMSGSLPLPDSAFLKLLINPAFTGSMLRRMGTVGKEMEPLFRHTANATIINGGEKANVIPSEVTVNLDCRMLPGYDSEDLLGELQAIAGPDIEFRAVNFQPKPWIFNMGLFDTLAGIISEQDPEGVSVPMLMPAGTDGRHFAQLGIQTYGWMPMNLPANFDFLKTIHAANERVPVSALEFGAEALYRLLQRFHE